MGKSKVNISELKLWQVLTSGFTAAGIAEAVTLPLDTIKVQMQVYQCRYSSGFHCGSSIVRFEGVKGLFKGLKAGIARQFFFGMTRLGIYDVANGHLQETKGKENITLLDRIFLGVTSGGLAMVIANPVDVIKIRFQSDSRVNPRYTGLIDAAKKITKAEGLKGFYQSLAVNVGRNSIKAGAELACYDQTKTFILKRGWMEDDLPLHLLSSTNAGFIATVVSSPYDVLKSVYMNGKLKDCGNREPYQNAMAAVRCVYGQAGIKGFFKGFNASCQRTISWNVIMFVVREQLLLYFSEQNKRF